MPGAEKVPGAEKAPGAEIYLTSTGQLKTTFAEGNQCVPAVG